MNLVDSSRNVIILEVTNYNYLKILRQNWSINQNYYQQLLPFPFSMPSFFFSHRKEWLISFKLWLYSVLLSSLPPPALTSNPTISGSPPTWQKQPFFPIFLFHSFRFLPPPKNYNKRNILSWLCLPLKQLWCLGIREHKSMSICGMNLLMPYRKFMF